MFFKSQEIILYRVKQQEKIMSNCLALNFEL